ncbi:MFS transporter [Gordonia sp. HY002]|uniref:MFS transporter n=1 Tax=Gordonia zhenghanii TaxID=2911516 RepID=UPI001EEFBE34|nr:MFS transporter [Gordonia zhenghanii]MCF8568772.1 MFS transporter [Gordonia zhenghanii]MCF8606105.1 MFS transporter [Gordonia zhenghanii]
MNSSMISTGLPAIMAYFHTDQGGWIQASFLLVAAVISPTLGKIADMVGKRRVLLFCVFIAAAGSLVSAVAPNFALLLTGRAMSSLLVSCLFLSYSLVRDVYPPKIVAMSVALITSGMGIVLIATPFLTGWLLDAFGWRSLFWFFTIILVITGISIKLSTDESTYRLRSKIDLVGGALLGGGIGAILIAVSFGVSWGWASGKTLGLFLVGAVLLGLWIYSATVILEPLIDLRLLTRRSIGLTAIAAGMGYGSTTISATILPMMCMTSASLGLGYGFSIDAEGFALIQSPLGVAQVLGGILVGVMMGRGLPPRILCAAGTALLAVGAVVVVTGMDTKWVVMVAAVITGAGTGLTYSSIPNLQFQSVPPELQASTASIVATCQSTISAILPVAVFTVLNSNVADVVDGVPLYTSTGMALAWISCAVVAIIALVATILVPRNIVQVAVPTNRVGEVDRIDLRTPAEPVVVTSI